MVRCKFICNEVSEQHIGKDERQWKYKFNVVYGTSEENKVYWKFTPTGGLEFQCMNKGPLFEAGAEYYIDITPAPDGIALPS